MLSVARMWGVMRESESRSRSTTASRQAVRKPLPSDLRAAALAAGRELREPFGRLDRVAADQVARLIRGAIAVRRRPGRKTTQRVLKAAQLRGRHVPWGRVYHEVLPDYSGMKVDERFYETHKLRDAVGQHFRRRRTQRSKGRAEDRA